MKPLTRSSLSDAVIWVGLLLASPSPSASQTPVPPTLTPPTLLLDPVGLADRVDAGDVLATAGDAVLFWLDEVSDPDPRTIDGDESVRLVLWRSDGTPEGTFRLQPPNTSLYNDLGGLGDVHFFSLCPAPEPIPLFGTETYLCDAIGELEVWRTDGTTAGTYRLLSSDDRHLGWSQSPMAAVVPELGRFFFLARAQSGGTELWVSDGTREGTERLADLRGLQFPYARDLIAYRGSAHFVAVKQPPGPGKIWLGRSDGTAGGTTFTLAPNDGDLPAPQLFSIGTRLIFYGYEEAPESAGQPYQRVLWAVRELGDHYLRLGTVGVVNRSSLGLQLRPGRLFATLGAPNGSPLEMLASDGVSPLQSVADLTDSPRLGGSIWRQSPRADAGQYVGTFYDFSHGLEPWVTDGTAAGTHLLADICPGSCSSNAGLAVEFAGELLFGAGDESHGYELWRWRPDPSDLEATGTVARVADLCPGECSSEPGIIGSVDGLLFVTAQSAPASWSVWAVAPGGGPVLRVGDLPGLHMWVGELIFARAFFSWGVVGKRWIFWARNADDQATLWSVDLPGSSILPPGPALSTPALPGFRFHVRISGGSGGGMPGRAEPACIPETLCVSGAVPGRSEVFVRVVGPKPNGNLWPTIVKFTTSTVEVWIEQLSTGIVRYYELAGASPGSSELPGLFDRDGFPATP